MRTFGVQKYIRNQGSYVEKIYISFMLNARQSFLSTSMDLYMCKGLFSSLLCQTFFHTMLFFQQMKRPIVFSNCKHLHHDRNFFLERCEIIDLLPSFCTLKKLHRLIFQFKSDPACTKCYIRDLNCFFLILSLMNVILISLEIHFNLDIWSKNSSITLEN